MSADTPHADTQGDGRGSTTVTPTGRQVEALLAVIKDYFDVYGDPSINVAGLVADLWAALDRAAARPAPAATHTDPAAQGGAQALRDAAEAARRMHDPAAVEPDCAEWADWLDARADRLSAEAPDITTLTDGEHEEADYFVGPAREPLFTQEAVGRILARRALPPPTTCGHPNHGNEGHTCGPFLLPPAPGQRTVTVTVYTDEPGPDVTEVEDAEGAWWVRQDDGLWASGRLASRWSAAAEQYGPMHPVGTHARLRGDA